MDHKHYIDLSKEKKALLARRHKTSKVTVWSALNYQTNSTLARQIRREALEMGGVETESVKAPFGFLPTCTTQFEHENNRVTKCTHTFSSGVTVTLDHRANAAEIRHKGHLVKRFKNPKLEDWTQIQFTAQNLSDEIAEQ